MGHLKAEEAKEYTTSLLGIFSTTGVDSFEKGERERSLSYGCTAMSLHLQTLPPIIFIINKETEVYNFNPQLHFLLP